MPIFPCPHLTPAAAVVHMLLTGCGGAYACPVYAPNLGIKVPSIPKPTAGGGRPRLKALQVSGSIPKPAADRGNQQEVEGAPCGWGSPRANSWQRANQVSGASNMRPGLHGKFSFSFLDWGEDTHPVMPMDVANSYDQESRWGMQ
eukprot:scaffold224097_cov15-Tisochrysis_lutea.AAC.1